MSVRHSPLREAIYLTNKSVRKFKLPSAYAKANLADGLSLSLDTNSINASKERIGILKEMISLPSVGVKRKDLSMILGGPGALNDSLNMSNVEGGPGTGSNRLSQIKEMMESTTSLLTNPNLLSQMGSTGNAQSFKLEDDDQVQIGGTDSPRLFGSEIYHYNRTGKMISKKSASIDTSGLGLQG